MAPVGTLEAPSSPGTDRAGPKWRGLVARLDCPAGHVILLLLLSAALFFYGLEAGDLWLTEGLRAIIAEEFLRSGNWVVPTLYGHPLFTKPPGMYAAIAMCSLPWGEVTTWSARLPSALAASIIVFLTYWYFSRQLGRRGGLLAAVMMPLSPLWLEKATTAEIDMLQVMWVTAAILLVLRALEEDDAGRRGWGWWLTALSCVAGGVLTKWTAPAFFYLTLLPLLAWQGRLRLLFSPQHLVSAAVAVGVCVSWVATAVALTGWEVFSTTVMDEALPRLVPGHSYFPYVWKDAFLHPLKLLMCMLPWSLLALWALRPSFMQFWDARNQRLVQALHCWAWPSMLFWCLPADHTTRHSFPLFPAVSGLAALVMWAWFSGKLSWRARWLSPVGVVAAMLMLWLAAKVVYVEHVVPGRSAPRKLRSAGETLAQRVPAGTPLHVLQLNFECVMFYYDQKVVYLPTPAHLPALGEDVYCFLPLHAWQRLRRSRPGEILERVQDESGIACVLVRLQAQQAALR